MTDTVQRVDVFKQESRELINTAKRSEAFLPQKQKRKPTLEELQIRDWITELMPIMSEGECRRTIAQRLGKNFSMDRLKSIRERMVEDARANFRNLTSFEVAVESRENYLRMQREGWKMVLEAETMVRDEEKSVELRLKGLEFLRKSQESLDMLHKLVGLHKEEIWIHQGDPTKSPEWRKFQTAVLLFMKYVLKRDPQEFIDFVTHLSQDPAYLDQYVSYDIRRRHEKKKEQWEEQEGVPYDLEVEPVDAKESD